MKNIKRIFAMVLALTLVLALTVTAFATEAGGYTITIKPKSGDNAAHSYEAYQIFKGDLTNQNDTAILSNITWGDNVDQSKLGDLAAAINGITGAQGEDALTAASSAEAFADAISALNASNDSAVAQSVADAFGAVLTGAPKTGSAAAGQNAEIAVTEAGYYLVKDQDNSLNGEEDAAYTRFILQVVNDVEVEAKSSVPTVDKKIQEGEDLVNANNASIGDEIQYVINSTVPDMTGYEKYYFVLNDTMSQGLTFNNDVTIKIGGQTLDADDYTVTSSVDETTGKTSIKIVLKNFIQYKSEAGAAIEVSYTATLNENADLTPTGNPNEVTLTYSNDPNYDYAGEPGDDHDEPGENEPVGVTPKSETKTFSTGIELIKVDGNNNQALTGAKFQIAGEKLNVTLINEKVYEPANDGTWYMLKDGTYTETEPTEQTADSYDSTTQKYKVVEHVTEEVTKEQVNAVGYVDSTGHLKFEGLAAGTYTITELVAPDGYNALTQPITVVITGTMDDTNMTCTWTATKDGAPLDLDATTNLFPIEVENKKGSQLPSTGGIGTTIFYVLGAVLVLSAGVVLVVKKRAEI